MKIGKACKRLGVVLEFLTLTIVACKSAPALAASGLLPLPSLSATYREFHKASGTELSRARVFVSPLGMRIDQKLDDEKTSVYHNFQTGKMWFLNIKRRVIHEVPVDFSDKSQGVYISDTEFRLGFIDSEPCSSLDGVKRKNVRWRGRQVSLWECYVAPNQVAAMQLYDDSIGLVVRSEYTDGVVMQLENVQDRKFAKSFFEPSNKFRSVSMHELITGAPKIEKYDQ